MGNENNRGENLGSGYYRFHYTEEEKRRQYTLTESRIRELLSHIPFDFIVDEITEMYRDAKRRSEQRIL